MRDPQTKKRIEALKRLIDHLNLTERQIKGSYTTRDEILSHLHRLKEISIKEIYRIERENPTHKEVQK